jgi:hypothetical protein
MAVYIVIGVEPQATVHMSFGKLACDELNSYAAGY